MAGKLDLTQIALLGGIGLAAYFLLGNSSSGGYGGGPGGGGSGGSGGSSSASNPATQSAPNTSDTPAAFRPLFVADVAGIPTIKGEGGGFVPLALTGPSALGLGSPNFDLGIPVAQAEKDFPGSTQTLGLGGQSFKDFNQQYFDNFKPRVGVLPPPSDAPAPAPSNDFLGGLGDWFNRNVVQNLPPAAGFIGGAEIGARLPLPPTYKLPAVVGLGVLGGAIGESATEALFRGKGANAGASSTLHPIFFAPPAPAPVQQPRPVPDSNPYKPEAPRAQSIAASVMPSKPTTFTRGNFLNNQPSGFYVPPLANPNAPSNEPPL